MGATAADPIGPLAAALVAPLDQRLAHLEELLAAIAEQQGTPERLMSREAAARWASCSVRTVDAWLADGAPHIRLGGPGGSPRMRASEILSWLRGRGVR